MWMQKGMEVERYRKESIANPNSIPAANNFLIHGRAKVIQNSAATFKRVIGIHISLQPIGTWIIFDNDRFDLDGAVKLKLQEALVVG
jgi:hypothetical protein